MAQHASPGGIYRLQVAVEPGGGKKLRAQLEQLPSLQVALCQLGLEPTVHLRKTRAGIHKASLDLLAGRDVESDPLKSNGTAAVECRPPTCRDPALHAVTYADHAVLDVIDPIAGGIGACGDRCFDTGAVVPVN